MKTLVATKPQLHGPIVRQQLPIGRTKETGAEPVGPAWSQQQAARAAGAVATKDLPPTRTVVGDFHRGQRIPASADVSRLLDKGFAADKGGHPDKAIASYDRAFEALRPALLDALDPAAHKKVVERYGAHEGSAKDLATALRLAKATDQLPAELAEPFKILLNRKGLALSHLDHHSTDMHFYDALAVDPKYAPAWYNLACQALKAEKNPHAALDRLERAIEHGGSFDFKALAREQDMDWNALRQMPRFRSIVGLPALPQPDSPPLTPERLDALLAERPDIAKLLAFFQSGQSVGNDRARRVVDEPIAEYTKPSHQVSTSLPLGVREVGFQDHLSFDGRGLTVKVMALDGGVGANFFTGGPARSWPYTTRKAQPEDLAKATEHDLVSAAERLNDLIRPGRASGASPLPAARPETTPRWAAAKAVFDGYFDDAGHGLAHPEWNYKLEKTIPRMLGIEPSEASNALARRIADALDLTKHERTYGPCAMTPPEADAVVQLLAESTLPIPVAAD